MNPEYMADKIAPEVALLDPCAPKDVLELLCLLTERRLQREINGWTQERLQPYTPTAWARFCRSIKERLIKRLRSVLVPDTMTVVQHDTHSQDFIRYVLRHRPSIPSDYFPAEDQRQLRHFVINKLLFGAVRVFETLACIRRSLKRFAKPSRL